MEYQSTADSIEQCGHYVHRLPDPNSEVVAIIPIGSSIRLTQVVNGWGKIDVSMEDIVKSSSLYELHDLNAEGWTMVSVEDKIYLTSVGDIDVVASQPTIPSTSDTLNETTVLSNPNVDSLNTSPSNTATVLEFTATNAIGFTGHIIRRYPTIDSEQIGTLLPGRTIRVTQVDDGWGKLDVSMMDKVKRSYGYKPHDLRLEGWTLITNDGQIYFTLNSPITTEGSESAESSNMPVLLKYRARLKFSGHGVYRLPTRVSECVGSLKAGDIAYVTQICDDWAKLDTSMDSVLRDSYGYKPHDLYDEGWVMISDDGQLFFDPVTTATKDSSVPTSKSANEYTIYRPTSFAPAGGIRVRRKATVKSDLICLLEHGANVRITRIENGWGKLHPSMESTLCHGRYYQRHNLVNEGWILMSEKGVEYFEQPVTNSPAPPISAAPKVLGHKASAAPIPPAPKVLEYRATLAINAGGHRIHKFPTTDSDQIGTLRPGCTIRLTQIVDGWGKLDIRGRRGSNQSYKLKTDGWTLISDNEQTYFTPISGAEETQPNNFKNNTPNKNSNNTNNAYPEYVTYTTTNIVTQHGLCIRRQPNLDSEQVGLIDKGATVRISTIQGNWGKVHPSMAPTVNTSYNFMPHDLNTEGWMRICDEKEGFFLIPLEPSVTDTPNNKGGWRFEITVQPLHAGLAVLLVAIAIKLLLL